MRFSLPAPPPGVKETPVQRWFDYIIGRMKELSLLVNGEDWRVPGILDVGGWRTRKAAGMEEMLQTQPPGEAPQWFLKWYYDLPAWQEASCEVQTPSIPGGGAWASYNATISGPNGAGAGRQFTVLGTYDYGPGVVHGLYAVRDESWFGFLYDPAVGGWKFDGPPTAALTLPRVDTTVRNALPAVSGMICYNTTVGEVQVFKGGGWHTINTTPAP
jgi:hypothetical protein